MEHIATWAANLQIVTSLVLGLLYMLAMSGAGRSVRSPGL
jgi:hypothetical protein